MHNEDNFFSYAGYFDDQIDMAKEWEEHENNLELKVKGMLNMKGYHLWLTATRLWTK